MAGIWIKSNVLAQVVCPGHESDFMPQTAAVIMGHVSHQILPAATAFASIGLEPNAKMLGAKTNPQTNRLDKMQNATDEVELLMHNARLRDELEPYIDESVSLVHFRQMNLREENCFLESMLAWERAPALPISCWSLPELVMPRPGSLDDDILRSLLYDTVERLFSVRVVLEMTEHLSDRQLFTLIYRDILPACEKKVDLPGNYLCWRCLDESDTETWLAYYATEMERLQWLENNIGPLPDPRELPYPRKLPRASEL